jgi:hypothetical protein
MDSDAKFNPPVGRDARVALDHSGLHFDCATGRIDHTAEFSDEPVAGALDDPAMVRGDRRLDQIAEERAEPRECSLLVRAGEPAITDDIGDQDRRDFPGIAHGASSCRFHLARGRVWPRSLSNKVATEDERSVTQLRRLPDIDAQRRSRCCLRRRRRRRASRGCSAHLRRRTRLARWFRRDRGRGSPSSGPL